MSARARMRSWTREWAQDAFVSHTLLLHAEVPFGYIRFL